MPAPVLGDTPVAHDTEQEDDAHARLCARVLALPPLTDAQLDSLADLLLQVERKPQ